MTGAASSMVTMGYEAGPIPDAIGAGAKMTILSNEIDGDTVRVRFSWSSSVFNGQSDGIFVLVGDKILSFSIPRH